MAYRSQDIFRMLQASFSMASVGGQGPAEIPRFNMVDDMVQPAPPQVAASLNNACGEIPVVLTDPDVLNCPICLEHLCAPIYQCENGHIACSGCCKKMKEKCPSCTLPIGSIRCRAMEKVTESILVDCENKPYGCTEPLFYHMKAEHERTCIHTLCFCPLSTCGFSGSYENLYIHFSIGHIFYAIPFSYGTVFQVRVRRDQKHMILKERTGGVIFILNHAILEDHGRVFDVDCVGPNSFRNVFMYQLRVRFPGTYISVMSIPEVCGKWEEHTPNNNRRLVIPSAFSQFTIDVYINRIA